MMQAQPNNKEKPLAIVIGASLTQLRRFVPVIEQVGFTVTVVQHPAQIASVHQHTTAALVLFPGAIADTIMHEMARLCDTPVPSIVLHDAVALPTDAFGDAANQPCDAAALMALLQTWLAPPEEPESPADAPPAPDNNKATVPSLAAFAAFTHPSKRHTVVARCADDTTPTPASPQRTPVVAQSAAPTPVPIPPPSHPTPSPSPSVQPTQSVAPPPPAPPTPAPPINTHAQEPEDAYYVVLNPPIGATPPLAPPPPAPPINTHAQEPEDAYHIPFVLMVIILVFLSIGGIVTRKHMQQQEQHSVAQVAGALTTTPQHSAPRSGDDTTNDSNQRDVSVITPTHAVSDTRSDLSVQIVGVFPPDAAVGDVINLQLRIHNDGTAAVTTPFWVDLYVSPAAPPMVNRSWDSVCNYGATWLVDGIAANETLVRETVAADPSRSNLLRFSTSGKQTFHALVDSYGEYTYGMIDETNESNNLSEPFDVVIAP